MKAAWVSGDIWWLVLAAGAWLVQRIQAAQKKAAATRPGADAAEDEAARTRRVQAEVRRRIAERRSAPPPAPPPFDGGEIPPEPVMEAPIEAAPGRVAIERRPTAPPGGWDADLATVAANQRAAMVVPRGSSAETAAAQTAELNGRAALWLAELRNPATVRRAVLLREILGPPIGLR